MQSKQLEIRHFDQVVELSDVMWLHTQLQADTILKPKNISW